MPRPQVSPNAQTTGQSMSRRSVPMPRPQVSLCPDGHSQCPDHRSVYDQTVSHNAQTTGQSMSRWLVPMPRPQVSLCPDGQSQSPDHRSVYVQMVSPNAQTTGQSMSRWLVPVPRSVYVHTESVTTLSNYGLSLERCVPYSMLLNQYFCTSLIHFLSFNGSSEVLKLFFMNHQTQYSVQYFKAPTDNTLESSITM